MPNNDYANEPNQSRSEEIIQSILDNTEYDEAARSRIEYLLIELKNAIEGGGGGGGVTSYSPLTEKPKIDNHTLQAGNNTSSDLGLQTKIDADHKLSADVIDDTNSTNKFNVKSDWNAASGATSEILNKPTLGTASAKNVPASGDAATGEVVLGSDTRLTDARNANDVYNWAKQENKPSYGYSEIQNTPTIPDELADLADDSTHRTVTDAEKNTWNAKQNALTFDNAPTSNSDNPVKSGGVYTALSGKQNNLSEAQMAAANSGATADKINKIAVNENNILLNTNNGVKNIWKLTIPSDLPSGFTITKDTDGGYIFNGTTGSSALVCSTNIYFGSGDYVLSGCPANGSDESYRLDILRGANTNYCYGEPVVASGFTNTSYQCRIRIAPNYTCNNLKFYPMICPKSLYDADPTYQPYALPNTAITVLEKQNEADDYLAWTKTKNILSYNVQRLKTLNPTSDSWSWSGNSATKNGVTFTINDDLTISTSGTATTGTNVIFTLADFGESPSAYTETMRLSGCADGGNYYSKYSLYAVLPNGDTSVYTNYKTGADIQSGTSIRWYRIVVRGDTNMSGLVFTPMVCTAANWQKSQVYYPSALSNVELTEKSMIVLRPSGNLTDQTVNTYKPNTIVNGYADSINGKTSWVTIVTQQLNDEGTRLLQNAIFSDGTTFTRFYNGTWGAWTNPLTNPKSGSVTWATGYTPSTSEVRIRQYGNIVCGQIYALFSDALPASTETTVGTITGVDKAGASVRLSVGVAPSQLYGTPTGMAYCFISSSTGSIVLKTGANETGKAFCINFTYTTADPS